MTTSAGLKELSDALDIIGSWRDLGRAESPSNDFKFYFLAAAVAVTGCAL